MKSLSKTYKFVNESKKIDTVQLLYLSSITNSTFCKMLKDKCKEYGITFLYANPETAVLEKKNDKLKTKFVDINDIWSIGDTIMYVPTQEEKANTYIDL